MKISTKLEGMDGVVAELQRRGLNVRSELTRMVTAAAEPIAEEAKRRATSDRVRKAIIVKVAQTKNGGRLVDVGIGPDTSRVKIGHLLEFGTAPHEIGRPGQTLAILGRYPVKGPVRHPGAAARPYLRPAHDTKKVQAQEIFAAETKKVIKAD